MKTFKLDGIYHLMKCVIVYPLYIYIYLKISSLAYLDSISARNMENLKTGITETI